MEPWSNEFSHDPAVYDGKLQRILLDKLLPSGASMALSAVALHCLQWMPEDRPTTVELYPCVCEL